MNTEDLYVSPSESGAPLTQPQPVSSMSSPGRGRLIGKIVKIGIAAVAVITIVIVAFLFTANLGTISNERAIELLSKIQEETGDLEHNMRMIASGYVAVSSSPIISQTDKILVALQPKIDEISHARGITFGSSTQSELFRQARDELVSRTETYRQVLHLLNSFDVAFFQKIQFINDSLGGVVEFRISDITVWSRNDTAEQLLSSNNESIRDIAARLEMHLTGKVEAVKIWIDTGCAFDSSATASCGELFTAYMATMDYESGFSLSPIVHSSNLAINVEDAEGLVVIIERALSALRRY